jgi:hypothetical protein
MNAEASDDVPGSLAAIHEQSMPLAEGPSASSWPARESLNPDHV